MLKSPFEPCIPSGAKSVPDRPEWIHEIKHDGYRLIVQREGLRVRLWTRFRHACLLGLEGMVSKHPEGAYRSGRFRHWIKVKNRQHPAFSGAGSVFVDGFGFPQFLFCLQPEFQVPVGRAATGFPKFSCARPDRFF